ncbi:MAG: dihydroxy-acid dehydratase [Alphaproteobacteria bacterium]|jgi:dihydroxy-acid dehydratase|nr:dihydroxy-acid dehydratase [Alphaproteobacteria bacterium]
MTNQKTGFRRRLANYGDADFSLYLRKAFAKSMGYRDSDLAKPIVGIANTYSGFVSCHGTVPELVKAVSDGVTAAGGLPLEFPTISLGESFVTPTSMYFRNLMALETEEMISGQPLDAVVLVGGCDKTVPAQLMAAASADVPAIQLVTGPMMTGSHRGEQLGACTDCRRYWAAHRRGEVSAEEIDEITGQLCPTAGTCMVMGTASTMACMTEAMGMMLPGGAAIPAVNADRLRHARETGRQAVTLCASGPKPSEIMTDAALTNALRVLLAIGGSTNGLVHLAAIAGRLGFNIDYARLDQLSRETPVLVDLKPSGAHYMEDLERAGGMAPVLRELAPLLDLDCLTVTGRTLGEELADAPQAWPQDVVKTRSEPVFPEGGIAVLRGNLAPDGAIIKQSAASPELLRHEGRAVVFDSLKDMAARIDAPDLDVEPEDILVLRNAGPKGAPGMPEAGYLPIPKKLALRGIKDMVRLSDARMSGTAFGTVVLHAVPEAAIGGPLALIKSGDRIRLDVAERELQLLVSDEELAARRAAWSPPDIEAERGWAKLYIDHVEQADRGCDLDFLTAPERRGTVPL